MESPHVKRKLTHEASNNRTMGHARGNRPGTQGHENIESHPCNGASAPTYGQQG